MNAEKEFINYITQFGTDEKIKLRRDHTFRVVGLCEIIEKRLKYVTKRNDFVNKITQININETNNKKLINQLKEIRDIINNYIEEMLQC